MDTDAPDDPSRRSTRRGMRDGMRGVLPLMVGIIPFALVLGATIADGPIDDLRGWLTSPIVFAGASQLALVNLVNNGTAAAVIVGTCIVINARHVIYSAAVAPMFDTHPRWWRIVVPYFLVDEAYVLTAAQIDRRERREIIPYLFGAGTTLWVFWQISTLIGVLIGSTIPSSWSLDFAAPLTFLVLLIPVLVDRTDVVAAIVGGAVAVATWSFPNRLGLLIGILAGIVAGNLTAKLTASGSTTTAPNEPNKNDQAGA